MTDDGFRSVFVTAKDGLRLHLREYGERTQPGLPVIILPGITRTAADHHTLASALAHDPTRARRVLAIDYRGRGLSEYDRNPDNYSVSTELDDLLTVMATCKASPAVLIGTSRGGLLTMALAAKKSDAIAGAILNDIGPVIEMAGLMRVKANIGRSGNPATYAEGAGWIRQRLAAQFPDLTDEDWLAAAHRSWRGENGHLVPTYDQALGRALATIDFATPAPTSWPQFDALAGVPLMVIRGALSDLLSAETVAAMRARRPDLESLELPRQGHAPLLAEDEVIERIATFVDRCNRVRKA